MPEENQSFIISQPAAAAINIARCIIPTVFSSTGRWLDF